MSRQERMAWFNLAIISVAVVLFLVLIPAFGVRIATAGFSILALIGFTPLFLWRRRGSSEVIGDERDRAINAKAVIVGYSVFWLYFVTACMVPYAAYGEKGEIPVEVLPMILWLGYSVLEFVRSMATIIQYRRGLQNAQG